VLEFCETKRQSAAQSKNPSPQAFLLLLLLLFFGFLWIICVHYYIGFYWLKGEHG
jgi:hypothetical protein